MQREAKQLLSLLFPPIIIFVRNYSSPVGIFFFLFISHFPLLYTYILYHNNISTEVTRNTMKKKTEKFNPKMERQRHNIALFATAVLERQRVSNILKKGPWELVVCCSSPLFPFPFPFSLQHMFVVLARHEYEHLSPSPYFWCLHASSPNHLHQAHFQNQQDISQFQIFWFHHVSLIVWISIDF
jgi:hypothetical protein